MCNAISGRDKIIQKGLEGRRVSFFEIRASEGEYKLTSELIAKNDIYLKDRLSANIYEIIGESEILPKVQNFNVLYKDGDKSQNAIQYFVSKFRDEHAIKPSNITIVDDKKAIEILNKPRNKQTTEEQKFLAEH